eukprot:TRINITY_DN67346_c0_g1_i1.p1 TRINITY_DN67346_c0_g1~~TRINITY_DN67346_c0_g1_i1.p1  ORF type:complete len:212 (+),score=55.20 TRINITY_DN67346_c0_g1_i1:63-638(+)
MYRIHFSVGEDEATLLTVFTKGLKADVEVAPGKNLEFAKNRAVDKLWQHIPFCHAAAALCSLRIFDAATGDELQDTDLAEDGMQLVLAQEPPVPGKAPSATSAEATAYMSAVSALGRQKLGLDRESLDANAAVDARRQPGTAGYGSPAPHSRAELQALPLKDLKSRLSTAGISTEGCLEKADLVDRLLAAQ